jgi:hypothetical protein
MSVVPSSSRRSRGGLNPGTVVAGAPSEFRSPDGTAKFKDREFPIKQPPPVDKQPNRLMSSDDPAGDTVRLMAVKLLSLADAARSLKTKLPPDRS